MRPTHRSGVAVILAIMLLVLMAGLMALSFWAGTTVESWPRGPMEDDNSRLKVYGYLQVQPRRGNQLLLTTENEIGDYAGLAIEQRTQAGLLGTRALMDAVISQPQLEIRNTNWFKSFKNPTKARQWLEKHFHAAGIVDSKLIKVWLDPIDSRSEAKQIVMDIVTTHLDQQRQAEQSRTLDRAQALSSLKTKYEIRIRELSDRQNNLLLRMEMGGLGTNNRYTLVDLELTDAIAHRGAADAAAATARAVYEELAADIQAGDMSQRVEPDNDPGMLAMREELSTADAEIRSLTQAGADAATIRSKQSKRDELDEKVRNLRQEKNIQMRNLQLSHAQTEMKKTEAVATAANKRVDRLKAILGDMAIAMSDYLSVQDELALTRKAAKEVRDQLDTISAQATHMSVDWAQRPSAQDVD